jgi:hypothetical protein
MATLAKTSGKLTSMKFTYDETQGWSFCETLSCGKQSIKILVFFYLPSTSTLPCHHRPISCGKITIAENVVGEVGYYFNLCLLGMAKFHALRHGRWHTLVSVNISEPQMGRAIGFLGVRIKFHVKSWLLTNNQPKSRLGTFAFTFCQQFFQDMTWVEPLPVVVLPIWQWPMLGLNESLAE